MSLTGYVLSLGSGFTDNPIGLYALLALIPLILLYLMRPKPKDKTIPSLMFVLKTKGKSKLFFFIRRFVTDFMFLLHLLILLAITLTIAEPFLMINKDVSKDNNVIVIDVSASMQAKDGFSTRFEKVLDEAKKNLDGKISIVLAANKPIVPLENVNREEALEFLNNLKPKATSTNIGDAMLAADQILGGNEGRILVLSDFITTSGPDPFVVKNLLESKGVVVDFVDFSKEVDNIGIVDIKRKEGMTAVYVRNYNDKEENVNVKTQNKTYSVKIQPRSIEIVDFDMPPGISQVKLEPDDDFPLDNVAYLSNPSEDKIKVLIITNKDELYIRSALEATGRVALEFTAPPVMPPSLDYYDIIILGKAKPDMLLSGTFESIESRVRAGGSFVIAANQQLNQINFKGFIPVSIGELAGEAVVGIQTPHEITENIFIGKVKKHFKASPSQGSVVLAATDEDNSTIISMAEVGKGKSVYFGVIEDSSDFKFSTSYPLFWNNLLNYFTGTGGISSYNKRTGGILSFDDEQSIKTPTQTITASTLLLDEVGIYEISGRKIASNLLDVKESDISDVEGTKAESVKRGDLESKVLRKEPLFYYLLIASLIFLFIELLIIKFRGDL